MTVPGSANTLLLRSSTTSSGYSISRSLRFNSADSAYLSRTPASAGNRRTWTWAAWVKRSSLTAVEEHLWLAGAGQTTDTTYNRFYLDSSNRLRISAYNYHFRITTQVFRDFSAWFHLVVAFDTTLATAANRVRVYVNGVEVTAFDTVNDPTQNQDTGTNSTALHYIGAETGPIRFLNGYLADCFLIDGQQLTPSAFGEFSATTGVWVPKAYSGPAPTGNSFWLPFSDNSAATATTLGKDGFNLGNNWTPNNLSVSGSSATYTSTVSSVPYSGLASAVLDSTLTNSVRVATSNYGTTYWTVTFNPPIPIVGQLIGYADGEATTAFRFTVNGTTTTNYPGLGQNGVPEPCVLNVGSATTISSIDFRAFTGSGTGADLYYFTLNGGVLGVSGYSVSGTGNDSLVDVPVNGSEVDSGLGGQVRGNYCTWNPLNTSVYTFTNGNLEATGYNGNSQIVSTIGVSSGKWYCEIVLTGSSGTSNAGIGISKGESNTYPGELSTSYGYFGSGVKINAGSVTSYGAAFVEGDVIGIALNMDAGTCTMYKNGASQGQLASGLTGTYFFAVRNAAGDAVVANFGQRGWAYGAPANHKALNTASLPASVVTKPSDLFQAITYTGNGSARSLTTGFSPDLVWVKARNDAYGHRLLDTVRGVTKPLVSSSNGAEITESDGLTAFNSDGFSLGTDIVYNQTSYSYAAWAWDAGNTTVTNTQGSITSSVRANATAGFSVVTYTGTGSNATVGHGLGVAPFMFIVKNRSTSSDWDVYHGSLPSPATNRIVLQSTAAAIGAGGTSAWNSTSPTSTVVSLGSSTSANANGNNHVMYCFAPVNSYSSFGSYVGNGSADGSFIYTGHRTRFLLIKAYDATATWSIFDAARDPYNVGTKGLYPNSSGAEESIWGVDFLSNGFKLRTSNGGVNQSGLNYIYASFAESPFAANNRAR